MPNVIVTSHQAFLTNEALMNIADTTFDNIKEFENNSALKNEICYCMDQQKKHENCAKEKEGRCF